jgi:methionine-rich copper-binding protein CopC
MPGRAIPVTMIVVCLAVIGLSAHLKVERTSPAADSTISAAPTQLQVWFSQSPTVAISSLTLEGPDGKVATGKATAGQTDGKPDRSLVAPITGPVGAGKYTVTWKTSGSDGHIQTGTFTFTFTPAF